MKLFYIIVYIFCLSFSSIFAQQNCLSKNNLKQLDTSWEKAQLDLNLDYIDSILAEDFIWVHNHANTIDDKKAVLNRVKRHLNADSNTTKSRISKDIKIFISGSTGIVSGYTIVDRGSQPTTYHYMRTYIRNNGKCYLMANQTMAIPAQE